MVVEDMGNNRYLLCFTEGGQPGVHADTPAAELHCAQMREKQPYNRFKVLETYPL